MRVHVGLSALTTVIGIALCSGAGCLQSPPRSRCTIVPAQIGRARVREEAPIARSCDKRSLEYTAGSSILEPRHVIRLQCDNGYPVGMFFSAEDPPPTDSDAEVGDGEVEVGAVEVVLKLDSWHRVWTSLAHANLAGLRSCEVTSAGETVIHQLELVDEQGETTEVYCFANELPEAWVRVVDVLEQLEREVTHPDAEDFWPFSGEYWRDELVYRDTRSRE